MVEPRVTLDEVTPPIKVVVVVVVVVV